MSIIRGQKSVGLSNNIEAPATLPPIAEDPDTIIQVLVERLQNVETLVEGKADADRIRTLIAYSDEAVLIKAQDIVLAGDVTIAKVINEQNGTTKGEVPESITRIIGDRIQTGSILSNNFGGAAGSRFDLDNGTLVMGGTDNPAFNFDGTDLTLTGILRAASVIEGTGQTLQDVADKTSFTDEALNTALAEGVGYVIAGQGGDYRLTVSSTSAVAQHKDANYTGLGAGYTGDLRTGLIVTANGIAMGYNRKSDGAWVNSVAIDSTGQATFAGKLSAATGTFSGSLDAASGTFSGSLSAASGTFKGSLSAASGTFKGDLVTSGQVKATGITSGDFVTNATSIIGEPSSASAYGVTGVSYRRGVFGVGRSGGVGVYGEASGVGSVGVYGYGVTAGYFESSTLSGAAIRIGGGSIIKPKVSGHILELWEVSPGVYEYEFRT